MKQLVFIIVAILLFYSDVNAQITLDPPHPTVDDAVVITLDATGTGLDGYEGEVYAHTGVNEWGFVIGSWGDNATQPHLLSLGDNLYELEIIPTIRDFYGVPANQDVTQLCFVFRSADGSQQSSDLFAQVYDGLAAVFEKPQDEVVYKLTDETINVLAAGPFSDIMKLYINGTEVAESTTHTINYDIQIESTLQAWELNEVVLKATAGSEEATDTFWYARRPNPTLEPMPAGVENGINYIDDETVILSLFAPFHEYVFVIGDFNDWQFYPDYYMNYDVDRSSYWVQIDDLEPMKEYIFQYLVDGELYVGDPYADKISDPWNDQYISASTYPDLIEYPEGKADNVATVLQTAQTPYAWEVEDFEPPAPEDAVIYELLVRDFVDAHDFNTLLDTLSYLKRLGVNVVELMPVSEFEGNVSWGYNPDFYFAPDKYYGPKNTFKAFIDECHKQDIAVVMDMVLNHSYGLAPYVRLWWNDDLNRPAANNPFYFEECPDPVYCWGNDFNHGSEYTKEFVHRVNNYWLEEYNIDGYRFDYTKGFSLEGNLGYDAWRIAYLKQMADKIWETKEDAYVILEHWCDNSEEKILANYGMMLWGNMNHNYCQIAMGYEDESNISWGSYKARGWNDPHLVSFMESHDEERMLYKVDMWGNSSGQYDTKDADTRLERAALAANLYLTVPGPKMIWEFGERGYDVSINQCPDGSISEDCRVDPKPPYWEYMEDYRNVHLYNVYRALIQLKKEHDIFTATDFDMNTGGEVKNIVLRKDGEGVVVIGNIGVESASTTIGFPENGTWYEFYSQEEMIVTGNSASLILQPGEYRIYSTVYFEKPSWLSGTTVIETNDETFSAVIAPNPTTGNAQLSFNLQKAQHTNVSLYHIDGRVAKIVADDVLAKGDHTIAIYAQDLPKGMYICKITNKSNQTAIKVVLK